MLIEFSKYQGTGNDFILLDNRQSKYSGITSGQVKHLCDRRFGIGADGLMLLNLRASYDFEMIYYNSDGNLGSMCGNGARCMIAYAKSLGLIKNTTHFLAADGEHEGRIEPDGLVHLKMNDVDGMERSNGHVLLNTGSPHYVQFTEGVKDLDVYAEGRKIRYNEKFAVEGVNVNFAESQDACLFVRTYERGVENETLSCGTGVTASAIASAGEETGNYVIPVKTPGGDLKVAFIKSTPTQFTHIVLSGPAEYVFSGSISL